MTRRRRFARLSALTACAAVALFIMPMAVSAQQDGHAAATITPRAALTRLFTSPTVQKAWFAPSFLAQVSVAQIQQVVSGLTTALGRFEGVQPQPDGSFVIDFQKGTDRAQIGLNGQGQIVGLFFFPPKLRLIGGAAALQQIRALPGQVSLLVLKNGVTQTAINADAPLAVGSAFKLSVLAGLQQRIKAHELSWDQDVVLTAQDKSLPSGILQNQPDGTRLTVHRLAELMISISDNTAADMLIHLVGRAAIDPLIPARDRPILTTHEAFVLKDPAHKDLRERYLHGDEAQRLAVLQQADRLPLMPLSEVNRLVKAGQFSPEVEWFFSTRQLCGLMEQVHGLAPMSLNPGVADPKEWKSVAYKGGSEPGVLNLTTMATAHDGATYCVSATWNNSAPLDETHFETLYGSVLHSLAVGNG